MPFLLLEVDDFLESLELLFEFRVVFEVWIFFEDGSRLGASFFDEFDVGEGGHGEVGEAGLAGAKELARAPDGHVFFGQKEAVIGIDERFEALVDGFLGGGREEKTI